MKKLSLIIGLLVNLSFAFGQDCVTIESILVDACTLGSGCGNSSFPACNCEGKNEMLRFSIGDTDQNVNDLVISWPNNAFQGICQDILTSQNTSDLNATIEACGHLQEPVNGVLPANSQVLVITSADMCTESNSFENLSDTLYVIYQCSGNYQGHFANHGSGFRTTTVSFGGSCSSTASYNRALLVTQSGAIGAEDGATVDFPADGGPVYYNNGCNAPVPTEFIEAGDPIEICEGESFEVSGIVQGEFSNLFWSGGTGSFDDPSSVETTYTLGVGDTDDFTLTLNAENCNGIVTDELDVTVLSGEVPEITPGGPLEICPGETIELTASGTGVINWSTGESGTTITISEPGEYSASIAGGCESVEASVTVTEGTAPSLNILPSNEVEFCEGASVNLSAEGDGDLEWSTGETTEEITVSEPDTYTVSLSNACGTSEESIEVVILAPPTLELTVDPEVFLCEGATVELSATGDGDFTWSTGENSSNISVGELGVYTVELTNDCGTDEATVEVLDGGTFPDPSISVVGNTDICPGESTVLVAQGAGNFTWSNGSEDEEIEIFLPGTYTLTETNNCGSVETSVEISQSSAPLVTIAQEDTVSLCGDSEIQLDALSSLPITWSNGSSGISISVSNPGLYYAHIANTCGLDTAYVQVLEGNPEAEFETNQQEGPSPLEVVFTNTSSNASDYSWNIAGEPISTDTNLMQTFYNEGVYTVTLTASDSAGCSDSFSTEIEVLGCATNIFVPNTFTPNGDGVNDLFKFVVQCVDEYEINIYNRWGVLLYTGQQGSPYWDGNNGHGSYVTDGVYIYTLRYKPARGPERELNGTITIFR